MNAEKGHRPNHDLFQWVADKSGGLSCYMFENLACSEGLRHAIFTRRGGGSSGPFHSLNVAYGVGDDRAAVDENRKRIAVHLCADRLVFSDQVHGDDILVLKKEDEDAEQGSRTANRTADAVISNIPGVCLVIQVADCQSVVLFDPVRRVVANIHSGWRGSVADIIGKTVALMKETFGSNPTEIMAGIGPSLGPCCAEFVNYRNEIPESYWVYKDRGDHFDFWAMSRDQLCRAGVPRGNINVVGCCTCCHPELFFSYRGEKKTGRFAVAVGLL